jgi:gamma-glutamyltranspeptidase / glutathione hydrolase
LNLADLSCHSTEVVEPASVVYRNVRIWELPPNTHGLVALLALNTLSELRHDSPLWFDEPHSAPTAHAAAGADSSTTLSPVAVLFSHNPARYYHLLIESLRWAFADARTVIADPGEPCLSSASLLLSPLHAQKRFRAIDPWAASADAELGSPLTSSDTISLQVRAFSAPEV